MFLHVNTDQTKTESIQKNCHALSAMRHIHTLSTSNGSRALPKKHTPGRLTLARRQPNIHECSLNRACRESHLADGNTNCASPT
jgi:hypothetical protein